MATQGTSRSFIWSLRNFRARVFHSSRDPGTSCVQQSAPDPAKERRPAARVIARRGVSSMRALDARGGKIPAATYSPTRRPCSTIGSGGLNFRVRDGNGWDPSDVATGNSFAHAQANCVVGRPVGAALDPGLIDSIKKPCREGTTKPHERLVPVSSTPCSAYTSGLSTSSSSTALQGVAPGRPSLDVCFPLRCFQRLSDPDTATQRCHWRDNWYTGGPSNPVLSY